MDWSGFVVHSVSLFSIFLALVFVGGKLVRFSLQRFSPEFIEISEDAREGWVQLFRIPGALLSTVLGFVNLMYVVPAAVFFFVVFPVVTFKLLGRSSEANVVDTSEYPLSYSPEVGERVCQPRKSGSLLARDRRSSGRSEGKEEYKKDGLHTDRENRKVRVRMKIEEIKIGQDRKKDVKAGVERVQDFDPKEVEDLRKKRVERDISVLKATLNTIESKYLHTSQPSVSPPSQKQYVPVYTPTQKDIEGAVRQIEDEVTRMVRKHRFLTWREARALRKRVREMALERGHEIKERMRRGEDIGIIAEEIYRQVGKEEPEIVPRDRVPRRERVREEDIVEELYVAGSSPEPALREKKKPEEQREEKKGSDDDILSLLESGESSDSGESSGGDEDIEELEKLLGEQ